MEGDEEILTEPTVESEGTTPSTGKSVQVDLNVEPVKPGAGAKPAATPTVDPKRLDAIEKWVAGTRRMVEKIERSILGIEHRMTQPAAVSAPSTKPSAGSTVMPAGTAQPVIDKYDQLVDENRWQEAVRLLAREEARTEYESQQQESARQQEAQARLGALVQSKARVAIRYPTLHPETGDNESPEAQLFEEVYQQAGQSDPTLLVDPHAPELLMHRMEDLAQARGIKLKPVASGSEFTVPSGRGSIGVRGGGLPPSRGAGGTKSNVVTLTPEQREYCEYHGIPFEDYAKSLKALGETGEVAAP